jgi:AraC-like DNA-binding protein
MGISVVLVRTLAEAVARAGVDVNAYFRDANFDPQQLEDPLARVEIPVYDRLQELALARTGDPALGLHMGEQASFSALGVAGHLAAQCRTLRDCTNMLLAYFRVLTDTLPPTLEEQGDRAILRYEFVRSSDILNRLRAEFALARFMVFGRMFAGPDASPSEVWFEHEAPRYANEYQRVFSCMPLFEQGCTAMVFPRTLLEAKQFHWDPQLFQVLRAQADHALTQASQHSVGTRIHDLVAYSDADVRPEMRDVARHLGMTERALRRRLSEEGSSFREVLDDAMRERTLRLLKNPTLSLQEIAERTGFSETSALHRAIRRWTGLTPMQLRGKGAARSEQPPGVADRSDDESKD